MSTFVRTTYTTQSLRKISKKVAVLLLIFLPLSAQADPNFQSSSNRYGNSSMMGASAIQYQPESYQMTNTSSYQVGTTYNPAQTIYEPFSNDAPGSNGPSRIGGRRNTDGVPDDVPNLNEPDRDEESPIGDAWSLLIFAALGAGAIYIKQRKRTEVRD